MNELDKTQIAALSRVGFIASTGYSGSTLLELILGNNNGVMSVGEMLKIADYFSGRIGDLNCSCGHTLAGCKFWSAVGDRLASLLADGFPGFTDFPLYVENERETIHRIFPTLPEALLLLGSRSLWRASATLPSVHRFTEPARRVFLTYQAIAEVAETPVIVDSSKHPFQAKVLFLTNPKPIRYIFLVRDGRGVALSSVKRNGVNFIEAARWWSRKMRNLHWMLRTIPKERVLIVRYEDLCADPRKEIQRLGNHLSFVPTVDFSNLRLEKRNSHSIGGNPMKNRLSEDSILLDEKWKRELDATELREFSKVAGSTNRIYGYD